MTPLSYDPAYSGGVRDLLIATATPAPAHRRRRIWLGASLVAGLSVLGAGGAVAAGYVLPGADTVTALDTAHSLTGIGTARRDLGAAPAGTNSLETTLTCFGNGTLTWPDGTAMTCSATDHGDSSTGNIPWTATQRTFNLGATVSTQWQLTYTFSHRQATPLKTNANGQTYGVDTGTAHPDLIAAIATTGQEGYINTREMKALDQSDPSNFHSPQEAVRWQETHPNYTVNIPVYLSDGTTKIGIFRVGG